MRAVSRAYKSALLMLVRQPSLTLSRLNEHWRALEKQILKQRQTLSNEIAEDDPIRFPIDLLSPIRRISDETIHTRALAYLLNPWRNMALEKMYWRLSLPNFCAAGERQNSAVLLRQKHTRVDVFPEYRYSIDPEHRNSIKGTPHNRSVARNDIRVEMHNNKNAAVIVIENKIDAPEGPDQLRWYEAKRANGARRIKAGHCLFISDARSVRPSRTTISGSVSHIWNWLRHFAMFGGAVDQHRVTHG